MINPRTALIHLLRFTALGLAVTGPLVLMGPAIRAEGSPELSDAPVRGIIKAIHQATLASELQARILRLPLREGDRFEKGDLLVEFDCEKQQADLGVAEAELRSAIATRDNNRKLLKLGAAGRFDVEVSEAQAEKAAAALASLEAIVKQCRLFAPFSGRILDLVVNEHDLPGSSGAIMKIADDRNLEIELIAPSTWLRWLKPGIPFTLSLDDTGGEISAKVRQIGAAVDAVSQTVKLTGLVTENSLEGVLPGMSGTAHFSAPER